MFKRILALLFPTISATFYSDYSLEESIERLRSASVSSVFRAGFSQAAVGSVAKDSVNLSRFIPFVANNNKPRFIGSFRQDEREIVLRGHFTASKWSKIGTAVWLGFMSCWTAVVTLATLLQRATAWWGPFFGIGMIVVGIGILKLNQWFARNDVAWLSRVIERAITSSNAPLTRPVRKPGWLEKKFFDLAGQ